MALDFRQMAERSQELALLGRRHFAKDMGFLHREFKECERTAIPEDTLEAALARELVDHAEQYPEDVTQVSARDYLKQWCDSGGYLVKKRAADGVSFEFRLTSASERVIRFVTQSRDQRESGLATAEAGFHAIFGAVKELTLRTETSEERFKLLQAQRDEIDQEIQDLINGVVRQLQPAQIRERLLKTRRDINEFIGDFRFIDEQFQAEAERLRETLIREDMSKGAALAEHLSVNEQLRRTDQGRSYYEFDRFIGSRDGRELLDTLEARMPALAREHGIPPEDFQNFGDRVRVERAIIRDTHARLSHTLHDLVSSGRSRELRRLHEEIAGIKQEALRLRETPPVGDLLTLDGPVEWNNDLVLGYESAPRTTAITRPAPPPAGTEVDVADLVANVPKPIDLARLRSLITTAARDAGGQISLETHFHRHPPASLAEIVGYLVIAGESADHVIDRDTPFAYRLPAGFGGGALSVRIPRVIYLPQTPAANHPPAQSL